MSLGSLKSLSKSLDQLFSDSSPPHDIPEDVETVILQYLSKHNTLELNNSTKLSDALYTIYRQRIATDFTKEMLFIKVLVSLLPNITQLSEFLMWIKKYLNISMDSAGHDISLVDSSKQLILSTMKCNSADVDCTQDLLDVRISHSNKLVHMLIDSYINPALLVDGEQQKKEESHEMEERKRFIKVKIRDALIEYAAFDSVAYSEILNEYLITKSHRLTALSLLSFNIAAEDTGSNFIPEMELLKNVINVLLYDESSQSIYFALNLLVMVIPHVAETLPTHLPKLFQIYARLICWSCKSSKEEEQQQEEKEEDDDITPTLEKPDQFDALGSKINSMSIGWDVLRDQVPIEGLVPDPSKLSLILYGLLPLSFTAFIRNPEIKLRDLKRFKRESDVILRNYSLHENFIKYSASEDELANYADFMKSVSSPEEIKLICLKYLPQNKLEDHHVNALSLTSPTTISSPPMTRNSSISTDLDSKSPLSAGYPNSELLSPGNSDNIPQQPLFRTPNYNANGNGNKPNVIVGNNNNVNINGKLSPGLQNLSTGNTKVIDSLLDTHKQLFFKNDSSVYNDFIRRHSLQTSIPDSEFTYSPNAMNNALLSLGETPTVIGGSGGIGSGQSVDFYRRELMILMNELDFQTYIKNGSIHLIQQLREEQTHLHSKLERLRGADEKTKQLRIEIDTLKEEIITKNTGSNIFAHGDDKTSSVMGDMVKSLSKLKQDKRKLEGDISVLQAQIKDSDRRFNALKHEMEPTRIELSTLNSKIVVLEGENEKLKTDISNIEQEEKGRNETIKERSYETLSLQEKKIHFLNEQITALVESNKKTVEDLKLNYQKQIDNLNEQLHALKSANLQKSSHLIMNLKANYESKIDSLTSSIYQLQEEFKMKETELIRLRTTKPINIPISSSQSIHSLTRSVNGGKPLLGSNFDRTGSGTDIPNLYAVESREEAGPYFARHAVYINDQVGPTTHHQGFNTSSHPFSTTTSAYGSQSYISKLGSKPSAHERDTSPPPASAETGGNIVQSAGVGGPFFKRPSATSQATTDTAPIVVKGRGGVQKNPRLKM